MNKLFIVIRNCFAGLYSLMQDPAGSLCLLSLIVVSILAFLHRVSDMAVVGCFTAVSGIAMLMKHKSFQGSDIDQPAQTTTISTYCGQC